MRFLSLLRRWATHLHVEFAEELTRANFHGQETREADEARKPHRIARVQGRPTFVSGGACRVRAEDGRETRQDHHPQEPREIRLVARLGGVDIHWCKLGR